MGVAPAPGPNLLPWSLHVPIGRRQSKMLAFAELCACASCDAQHHRGAEQEGRRPGGADGCRLHQTELGSGSECGLRSKRRRAAGRSQRLYKRPHAVGCASRRQPARHARGEEASRG
jgi:hypothetical protein